jgi:hypothetical protein
MDVMIALMAIAGPDAFALVPCADQRLFYGVPAERKKAVAGISEGRRSAVASFAQHFCIVQTVSPKKSFMMDINIITAPASYHSVPSFFLC